MKKSFILLLTAMLLMLTAATAATLPADLQAIENSAFEGDASLTGVLSLPQGVLSVGSRAFAGTGLHALILPEGLGGVEADVLAQGQAAYITVKDAETVVTGDAFTDVSYVFGPAGGSASAMTGFRALESLKTAEGFYFHAANGEANPLCAVDGTALSGTVTLPKFVDGLPVCSLQSLVLTGCDGITSLRVPSYLTIPGGISAEAYDAMTVSEPVPSAPEVAQGDPITWTVSAQGTYGEVAYLWLFDVEGVVSSVITSEPTVTWSPTAQGQCEVSVTVIDALDDRAVSSGGIVTVAPPKPVYRALLVGNIYAGQDSALDGCDNDVAAIRTVLSSMPGTDYSVTSHIDLTASEIKSAIASTFSGARSCDVSLFYFSGHGTSAGSLVGTGNSTITVSALRECLDGIAGTKIVIIDACYSGNMIGKAAGSNAPSAFTSAFVSGFSSYTKANLADNGYIVLTACSKDQFSQTLSDGTTSFGAFTYGLCYGSGYDEWNRTALGSLPADTDSNGAITLGEAYAKALERVEWLASLVDGMDQSAQYHGDSSFVLWSK